MRSVPLTWSARVINAAPPNARTAAAMRSSSVATITRVHERRRRGAPIHVLDHRLAGDVRENFSGETGGVEPRGDDGEDRRFSQRKWQTLDRIGVHDESYHRVLR